MSRIWITGTNGFLGSRIKAHLEKTHTIIEVPHTQLQYDNSEAVNQAFITQAPDVFIHCGAISNTQICEENPEQSYIVNVLIPEILAKACYLHHCKFIFCSSDQVYFEAKKSIKQEINQVPNSHKEGESLVPCNVYGKQKLEAENRILCVNQDAVALRLTWMYDYQTVSKCEHSDLYRNSKHMIQNNQQISAPIHDFRGITYVREVLKNIEKTFALPGGCYNFGSSNTQNAFFSVKALVSMLDQNYEQIIPNTTAFLENPRNMLLSQEKVQAYGIYFLDTMEGFLECYKQETKKRHLKD